MESDVLPTGAQPEKQDPGSKEQNNLLFQILFGIIAGIVAAVIFKEKCSEIAFLGEIFLTLLKMIVVPLVITSLICGITSIGDIASSGGIGKVAVVYFLGTTAISVMIGIGLVTVMKPGIGHGDSLKATQKQLESAAGKLGDKFEKIDKKFSAQDTGSKLKAAWEFVRDFITHRIVPSNIFHSAATNDILPLIFFAMLFGFALISMGETARPVIQFTESLNEVILFLVHKIILFAPLGIFSMVASKLGDALSKGEFVQTLVVLKSYIICVVLGLGIHFVIVLPSILYWFTGRNPVSFYKGMGKALLNAFSTASSSATLPLTLEGVTEVNGVDPRSARFVVPLGATINMDGTALYEAVAVIFMAQLAGIPMEPLQLFIIFITATLAAIGAAGIPEAGLVTMIMVIQSVNLPQEAVANAMALILVVDWFLDRCRTTVNVAGDGIGAAVVEAIVLKKNSSSA